MHDSKITFFDTNKLIKIFTNLFLFQKRFERSEKFALVHDPAVYKAVKNEEQFSEINQIDLCKRLEDKTQTNACSNQEKAPSIREPIHQELPMESSFLKIQIPTDKYLPSPKPWKQTVNLQPLLQPAKPQTDFNRCAKGFTGSFTSPYRRYCHRHLEETCEL